MTRVSVKEIANGKPQEDRHHQGSIGNFGFVGVYDGHGGDAVAQLCADRMHKQIKEEVMGGSGWPVKAIYDAFVAIDITSQRACSDGSTASIFMWCKPAAQIIYANVGDSSIVINRGGVAIMLSQDHNCRNEQETERILSMGGSIINNRIDGKLMVTRTIGDQAYKPYATSKPFIGSDDLLPSDEFVIIASDGLWDEVPPQQAVDEACRYQDADVMAEKLIELAVKRRSKDNITVGIILFRDLQPRKPEEWSIEQQMHLHNQGKHQPFKM